MSLFYVSTAFATCTYFCESNPYYTICTPEGSGCTGDEPIIIIRHSVEEP